MLDFTKSAKRCLAVNLIDNQSIRVRMPTKRVFDALLGLKDHLTSLTTEDGGQLGDIYDLIAVVLSNNLEHKPVTSEYLAELFDIEDVQTFFQGYMAFISGVVSDPNYKSPPSQTLEPGHTSDA
jgi:hypothetical protein